MLEQSTRVLETAAPENKAAAEEMAIAMIAVRFVQDLIPLKRAIEIAEEHHEANTEEWQREVFAALAALEILRSRGSFNKLASDPSRKI